MFILSFRMAVELRISKSNNNCCVPQCSSTYKKGVSLHTFPKTNQLLFNKWTIALKMGKKVSPHMKVCNLHFKEDDFFFKAYTNQKARLKRTAVPSQNLPVRIHDCIINNERVQQRKERAEKRRQNYFINPVENEANVEQLALNSIKAEDQQNIEAASNLLFFKENEIVFQKTFEDKGCQVNTYEEFGTYSIDTLVDTNYKCKVLTGVVSLTIFGILVNAVSKITNTNTNLSCKNKILLTLMKLKLDLSFNSLAVLFKIGPKAARSYFHNTLEHLTVFLKPVIRFPPKEEILNNMPLCFDKYRSTRVILDCTEIGIEKSKCLKCRIKTYSHYKKKHTIKYLIGVAPSGLITFLSKGFGGRVSDKAIFNYEGLINKLDPGDAIMVDKGILIEDECIQNLIKLIRPPFLRKKLQFSKEDARNTASIARARVHVERAIQRIKIFKICKGTLVWTILPYMDNIMTIIVALTCLGPPILARDKFPR